MPAVTIEFDGSAQPNPGPAGAGAVVRDESGTVLAEISEPLGTSTSNVAEYHALLLALERALDLGATSASVRGDSELVVRQIKGEYAVKAAHLKPLHARAMALLAKFQSWTIEQVPRDQNTRADKLANAASARSRSMLGLGLG